MVQTTIGRMVQILIKMPGVQFFNNYIFDPDALLYLNNAGITDPVIRSGWNTYVKGLKSKGLWSLITAIYPFMGGSASTHKFNAKDPQDTNAAFRLIFNGGITHNANGVAFDGTSGYADAIFTPSTHSTLNNESMFFYSRTPDIGLTGWVDMGSAVSLTQRNELIARTTANNTSVNINSTSAGAGSISTGNTNGSGLFMGSRVSYNDLRLYRNGTQIGVTGTISNNGSLSNLPIYIGARRISTGANGFVARNFALAGMGMGFNSTQAADFYTLTQALQTTLGRQVNP